ncbi:MAG: CCA tRNA nucleotidyltransferase [Nitrosopumilus sp.]|uniref:CCA tRNA nucleotidyltransferase n=1 Tax=Nitrosopumilus sp. TaxID=2024843 RepID=UPI00247243E5|nr:CCA tRNA nucleotidyltransferase [Nitrosopumilus sp.]MDH5430577.1 CCA tRNA nucleotidyltransferase [Nitrosopumilus sp.]MDH5665154.1 CCA tRNA nucleotidyltransferase [Nitrosopumilus sp.]MDH5697038.1 CCA tRNA nucleotidyltransferase [Nitrosopumilus sp.]
MKQIISIVSKFVVPPKTIERSKKEIADIAFSLVEKEIKKYSEAIGLEFGGSFAKGTWLSKDADIDIFIKFKKNTSEEKFKKISQKIGFDSLKKYSPYVRFSQHPYVEAKIKNTKINVVPCYDVKIGEWKSAADRSSFHTEFMKKSLTLKMKNEVRVLKTFLKSNKIYGAEIAKQGFSGYISEVLIFEFGSFENLIKSISKIKENQIIGKTSRSFDTSIVVIDPIDSNRNLAAAISNENIGKFILISRAFKNKPSLGFFKNKKPRIANKFWNNLLVIKFDFKARSPDIIWGQIKRATSTISTQLELGGFTVLRSKSYTDQQKEAYLFFFLESIKISQVYQKKGPEFFREDSSHSFISKNLRNAELVWVGDERKIISLEKRIHTDAINFLKEFLKKNLQTGIPKGLQNDFKKGFKISIGNKALSKSIKEEAAELISVDGTLIHFN